MKKLQILVPQYKETEDIITAKHDLPEGCICQKVNSLAF